MSNPVLVHTYRGDLVETRHRGAVAVCDPAGRVVESWGDIDALVYPRSAVKALQALPLVESGAADHFNLSQAELALACSSHSGEVVHTDSVSQWLQRIGLDGDHLECGAHMPYHKDTADGMLREQRNPCRIHNNCSGKHSGMLTTSQYLGETLQGYIDREHPAQQRWFDSLGQMAGVDLRAQPWSRDGCGIPVIAMPLRSIATAFARFAVPDDLAQPRAEAVDRLAAAIAANPYMVAGSERLCTKIMELTGRRVMVKTGADGVYTAALPQLRLGIALKIDDGLGEAAQVALLETLIRIGALHEDELEALTHNSRMPITNTIGIVTGHRQASSSW